jgi:undecaprenyl diphosphate synthase
MKRIPRHIGIIPDGNRRWAKERGLPKEVGYEAGLAPGLSLFKLCKEAGVKELTFYGFTQDNTKRPKEQVRAFQKACVDAVKILAMEDADLLVLGNQSSPLFPKDLLPFTKRITFGSGGLKLNFLVNYGWLWDLSQAINGGSEGISDGILSRICSSEISRVDLITLGRQRRLSGFCRFNPFMLTSIIDSYWPISARALSKPWLVRPQDITLALIFQVSRLSVRRNGFPKAFQPSFPCCHALH